MHHKGRNRHHFEYWMDYALHPGRGKYPLQSVQMPGSMWRRCSWTGSAHRKTINGKDYTDHDPLAYFEKGKSHYLMHPQTEKELHGMLRCWIRRERVSDSLCKRVLPERKKDLNKKAGREKKAFLLPVFEIHDRLESPRLAPE